jgi:hypothetical protein
VKVIITDNMGTQDFFPDAKNTKINQGKFHAIAGNVWKGSQPPAHWASSQHDQTPAQTYFARADRIEINGGEFLAVGGNFVDPRPAPSAPWSGQHGAWGYPEGEQTAKYNIHWTVIHKADRTGFPPQSAASPHRFDARRGQY